jgi:hypothetical protein
VQIAIIPPLDLLCGFFPEGLAERIGEPPGRFGAEIAKTKFGLCAF